MLWSVVATIPAVAQASGPEAGGEPAALAQPEAAAPVDPAPSAEVPPPAAASVPEPAPPAADVTDPPVGETPAIAADMLDAEPAKAEPPRAATPTVVSTPSPAQSDASEDLSPSEAITRAYAPKFRPRNNPGRLNIAGRLMFANAGANDAGGGRFGGASLDVGQSWNRFGYAVTATAFGGRFALADTGTAEVNALLGAGPTVGLGRMALLGRGYLDLRLGYDFFYGVVNRRDAGTTVRPQSGDVTLNPTQNLAPHGPRVRLDLGLIALDDSRRFWHGIGVSMGYQALVGSFRGQMPLTHMLTLGLSYWMG